MGTHALNRTSPKGGPFFGTCMKCGRKNLPSSAALEPCDNPSGMTDDEALIRAIEGTDTPSNEKE